MAHAPRLTEEDYRAMQARVRRGGVGGGAMERDSPGGGTGTGRRKPIQPVRIRPTGNSRKPVANPAPAAPLLPITLHLSGQLPGGKNRVRTTRAGRRYPEPRFLAWREGAIRELRQQYRQGVITESVSLTIDYWPSDRRQRDVDAMLGALGHLLERAGVLRDDAQIRNVYWSTLEGAAPAVFLTLRPWTDTWL